MNHILLVSVLKSLSNLRKNGEGFIDRQGLQACTPEVIAQGTILGIFSDEIGGALMYTYIIKREYVGMLELFKPLRFLQKTFTFFLGTEVDCV